MVRRLDHILSTPTKVAVLRLLCRNRKAFTGREIARRVGKGAANVHRALEALDHAGVVGVEYQRPGKLFRISPEVPLVREGLIPLFDREAELTQAVWDELARVAGPELVSMVLFGSQARGEAQPHSDTDLLFVIRSQEAADRVQQAVFDLNDQHRLRIRPLFVLLEDFPLWAEEAEHLWRSIRGEGRVLKGETVHGLERHVRQNVVLAG